MAEQEIKTAGKVQVPDNLIYVVDNDAGDKAIADRRHVYRSADVRDGGYQPLDEIIFDIPSSDATIDMDSVYFSCDFKTSSANANIANAPELLGPIHRIFSQIRIEDGSGTVLERINDLNMMEDLFVKTSTASDVKNYMAQDAGQFKVYKKWKNSENEDSGTAYDGLAARQLKFRHRANAGDVTQIPIAVAAGANAAPSNELAVSALGVPLSEAFVGLSKKEADIINASRAEKAIAVVNSGQRNLGNSGIYGLVPEGTKSWADEKEVTTPLGLLNALVWDELTDYGKKTRLAYQTVPLTSAMVGLAANVDLAKMGLFPGSGCPYTWRFNVPALFKTSKLFPLRASKGLRITLTLESANQAMYCAVNDGQSFTVDRPRIHYDELTLTPEVKAAMARGIEGAGVALKDKTYTVMARDNVSVNMELRQTEGLSNVTQAWLVRRAYANQRNIQANSFEYIGGVFNAANNEWYYDLTDFQIEWNSLLYPQNKIDNTRGDQMNVLYKHYLKAISGSSDGSEMVDTIAFDEYKDKCHVVAYSLEAQFMGDQSGISTRDNHPIIVRASFKYPDGVTSVGAYRVDLILQHDTLWTFTKDTALLQK